MGISHGGFSGLLSAQEIESAEVDAKFKGIRVNSLVSIKGNKGPPLLVVFRDFIEDSLGEGDGIYWVPKACVIVNGKKAWINVDILEPIDLTQ